MHESHIPMFGCRYGMELWRKGLKVTILSKTMLGINLRSFIFCFQLNFSRTERVLFGDEVVAINCF